MNPSLLVESLDWAHGGLDGERPHVLPVLLQQELDGGLQVLHLLLKVVTVGDQRGKLSSLVQTGSQKPGDLLDQSVRSKESIKLLGKLLNLLLVLIQLLEVISGHAVHAQGVGLVTMLLISEEADLVLLAR